MRDDYFNAMDDEEYLKHYGVLGMKWGVRHSKQFKSLKKSAKASYKVSKKKAGKNRVLKKAAKKKFKDKIAKAREKSMAELYPRTDKKVAKKVANDSLAKTLAKASLYGSYGAVKYDESRVAGKGRYRSSIDGEMYRTRGDLGVGRQVVEYRARKKNRKKGR